MTQRIATFGGSADMLVLADDQLGLLARGIRAAATTHQGPRPPSQLEPTPAREPQPRSLRGDDTAGTINITTGTGPSAGVLAVITFANAWTTTAPFINVAPKTAGAASLGLYATATTTTLTISCANAPAASTVYSFDYQAIGGA